MNTQCDQPEIKTNTNTEAKKEYQAPIFNEFGSLVDLTAGDGVQNNDEGFTGTHTV